MNAVLVHGAWADGSSWSEVIRELQDRGHTATAVQLPMTSLAADVEVTRRAIAAETSPMILVGHSYGGFVISAAAIGLRNVQALVFVAAYVPKEHETVAALSDEGADMPGGHAIRYNEGGWTRVDTDGFGAALGHDLPRATRRILAAVQGDTHIACLTTPVGGSAWRTIASHYVVATEDAILDPALQRSFAERASASVTEIRSSHLVMVSHPQRVADAIELAVDRQIAP